MKKNHKKTKEHKSRNKEFQLERKIFCEGELSKIVSQDQIVLPTDLPKPNDKFLTYYNGCILENVVVGYNKMDGVRQFQTPGIDMTDW